MRTKALIVGLVVALPLGVVSLTGILAAPAERVATHATLSLSCGGGHAISRLVADTDQTCSIKILHPNGYVPRLILDFRGLGRWATLGDASGKLGWNPADADYAPRRIQGHKTLIDFGVSAEEVHFTVVAAREGYYVTTIRAYVGSWDHARPRIASSLRGATLNWSVLVRK